MKYIFFLNVSCIFYLIHFVRIDLTANPAENIFLSCLKYLCVIPWIDCILHNRTLENIECLKATDNIFVKFTYK
jgi:hypothetical protein